ncbi:hypothetical protein ACHQM5_003811 [Ranunculus cassubicifolius]
MAFSMSRFYRKFCTQTSTEPLPSLRLRVQNLFKESNLSKVVSDFKQLSETSQFRGKQRVYEHTVLRLASAKKFSEVNDILDHHKKYEDITREGFTSRLISLYGKAGMVDNAYKLFDEMSQLKCERSVKSFNAVLQAYVQGKEFSKVEKLFREVPARLGIAPDRRSYNVLARALCEMKNMESAEGLLDEMVSKGVQPDLITYNTIMHGFYSDGRFVDGERIWGRMEKSGVAPDMVSFNSKLAGLIRLRKIGEAQKLLKELKKRGKDANVITYNTLITWFCNEGDLDKAKAIYDCMVKDGCAPNGATFRNLIPSLCKKGDFDLVAKLREKSEGLHRHIDLRILQNVVNGLVKESKVEEAEKLVEIIQSKSNGRSVVKMPAKVE